MRSATADATLVSHLGLVQPAVAPTAYCWLGPVLNEPSIRAAFPKWLSVQMSKAHQYQHRVERCQRKAEEAVSESVRTHWLELAECWKKLVRSEEVSEWLEPSKTACGPKSHPE